MADKLWVIPWDEVIHVFDRYHGDLRASDFTQSEIGVARIYQSILASLDHRRSCGNAIPQRQHLFEFELQFVDLIIGCADGPGEKPTEKRGGEGCPEPFIRFQLRVDGRSHQDNPVNQFGIIHGHACYQRGPERVANENDGPVLLVLIQDRFEQGSLLLQRRFCISEIRIPEPWSINCDQVCTGTQDRVSHELDEGAEGSRGAVDKHNKRGPEGTNFKVIYNTRAYGVGAQRSLVFLVGEVLIELMLAHAKLQAAVEEQKDYEGSTQGKNPELPTSDHFLSG